MAEVLARNGTGDMSLLDGIYHNGVFDAPPPQDGTDRYSNYHNKIGDYLNKIGEPGTVNDLMQTYWNTYTSSVFGAT
jgi:hypothetical protein